MMGLTIWNDTAYEKFKQFTSDPRCIGLADEENEGYFCTPLGAAIIGWDGCIHSCFIKGFGKTVFAVNPETCCEHYVYPIASNFTDFLRLILAANGTNALQQIPLWSKQQYDDFVNSPKEVAYTKSAEVAAILQEIRDMGLSPMPDPYEYVSRLQREFDYWKIPYSEEFYDATGLPRRS